MALASISRLHPRDGPHPPRSALPQRALVELYDAPFEMAVHRPTSGTMCSVGMLDGVSDCADPDLYQALTSWAFKGFIPLGQSGGA